MNSCLVVEDDEDNLALTSYAMIGGQEHIIEAYFSGYLQKPIDAATIIGQMESIPATREQQE